MTLLQFDKFELIKLLRNNRNIVLYCTLLARAQTPAEKSAIEETMRNDDELAPILAELREGTKMDTTEEEKARKAALRKVRLFISCLNHSPLYSLLRLIHRRVQEKLDAELDASEVEDHKTSSRGPKQLLNLDALTFAQGSHLMANNKCVLPEGSMRRQQKVRRCHAVSAVLVVDLTAFPLVLCVQGYEEVFIPALKSKPLDADEKLVTLEDMPKWAHPAFEV